MMVGSERQLLFRQLLTGVSEKESRGKVRPMSGVSLLHKLLFVESHCGVSRLSSDLLMNLEPVKKTWTL